MTKKAIVAAVTKSVQNDNDSVLKLRSRKASGLLRGSAEYRSVKASWTQLTVTYSGPAG